MVANKILTLVFIRRNDQLLLGYKKRGFACGRWNGFGGKVEEGETIEQGAIRELNEESGVVVDRLDEVGVLMFEFKGDRQLLEVHVFLTDTFSGTIVETEEMRPQWYDICDVPFSQMWPDDQLWFPLMLSGQTFYGYFTFDGMDIIINSSLKQVDQLKDVTIPQEPQTYS